MPEFVCVVSWPYKVCVAPPPETTPWIRCQSGRSWADLRVDCDTPVWVEEISRWVGMCGRHRRRCGLEKSDFLLRSYAGRWLNRWGCEIIFDAKQNMKIGLSPHLVDSSRVRTKAWLFVALSFGSTKTADSAVRAGLIRECFDDRTKHNASHVRRTKREHLTFSGLVWHVEFSKLWWEMIRGLHPDRRTQCDRMPDPAKQSQFGMTLLLSTVLLACYGCLLPARL